MKKQIDLFEYPEKMPPELAAIFSRWEDRIGDELQYFEIEQLKAECEQIGYTFDFTLDAICFDLRPMKKQTV